MKVNEPNNGQWEEHAPTPCLVIQVQFLNLILKKVDMAFVVPNQPAWILGLARREMFSTQLATSAAIATGTRMKSWLEGASV